jgi:hypothetical protein
VARWTRSCQGGSLDQGELDGGGWVEGGSPRRAVDGGEVNGGEVIDGGADGWLPK